MEAKPLDFGKIFERTWERFTKRFVTFLLYYLMAIGVAGLAAGLLAGALYGVKAAGLPLEIVGTALGALFLAAALWLAGWCIPAYYHLAIDDSCGIREAFERAKGRSLDFWSTILLPSLAAFAGIYFCFVPAFFIAALFVFVPFLFVEEGLKGSRAAFKSANMIRVNFWMGLLWVFIAYVTPSVAGAIPILGIVLSILAAPFPVLMLHEVYKDFKTLAPSASDEGDALARRILFGMPLLGLAITLAIAAFILLRQA